MVLNAGLFILDQTITRGEFSPRVARSRSNSKMHQNKAFNY